MSFSPPMHEPPYVPRPVGEALAEAISAGFAPRHSEDATLTARLHRCAKAAESRTGRDFDSDRAGQIVKQIAALIEDLENEVGAP